MSTAIIVPTNNTTPKVIQLPQETRTVMRVSKDRFAKLNTTFSPVHAAQDALVVPPEVLFAIKQAEGHVVMETNSGAFKDKPIKEIVDRPEIINCLEIIKEGSTTEIGLRACVYVSPSADKSEKKVQEADLNRLWRLHPATIDALKANALSQNSIYARNEHTEVVFKRLDKLKASLVEDTEGKKNPIGDDYPRVHDFGEKAKLVSTQATMAISKNKADLKSKAEYEKTTGRSDSLKRKYVELLSDPNASTMVYKVSKGTVVSSSTTADGSLIFVVEKDASGDVDMADMAEEAGEE